MIKSYRKRIRNIDKQLRFFLRENDEFFIGLLFEDYIKSPLLSKYGLPKEFDKGFHVIPSPKGSVTKANVNGKFVRKTPEEKETIIKHIEFIRKDGGHVSYHRNYYVYKKVMSHKINMELSFLINKHGQKLVVSKKLKFDKDNQIKNTHSANIFNEIFNDFEIFTDNLDPAINFNTKFDKIILPSGHLDEDSYKDLVEIGGRFSKNEEDNNAYQKRLKSLVSFNPELRGKGPNGFYGYVVFGYNDYRVIILESIYGGNATYVFDMEDFESKIFENKQEVIRGKIHLKRIYHDDKWEEKLKEFMDTRKL